MSETLYLVDGSGYIFRAYYAVRPLNNSKGLPTNALYGFTTMLMKLIREKKPDHLAVIFDAGRKTFRNREYPEYKANRLEPPEDLIPQFPYFPKIVEALNIPCLKLEDYEADDIIATIARGLSSKKLKTVIVTGDKDLMQLVSDGITLLDTMKDKVISFDEVKERFGVGPERVTDILGMAGDTSDNIPGIPGVGEKTAAKLLHQYDSLEGVIEHADELKGKMGEKVRANIEEARLFKRLATVKDDVPIDYNFDDFKLSDPDPEAVRSIFSELEFHTLTGDVAPEKTLSPEKYKLVKTKPELKAMIKALEKSQGYALDTETTSLDAMQAELVGMSFSAAPGEAYYVPVGHVNVDQQVDRAEALEALRPLLEDGKVPQYGQNIKYDYTVLQRHGIELGSIEFDTMIAAYCVNPSGSHGMDALSLEYLSHKCMSYKDVVGTGKKQISFAEVPLSQACLYAAEDADVTYRLALILKQRLKEEKQEELFQTLEMPLMHVLIRMEVAGVKLDQKQLTVLSKEYEKKIEKLTEQIYKDAGEEFNIKSTKQLGQILFDKMEIPVVRKTKTGYSTDTEVLTTLADDYPIAERLLEYRALTKLKSTYVDALPELINAQTGRIHTSFNQTVAATGRLSSSDPNLQNIPIRSEEGKRIREAFVAEKGHVFLDADYSQIELRILAHMSQDPQLLDAFENDVDIHSRTAAGLFGVKEADVDEEQRAVAKTVNFGVLYGQSAYGLSGQLGIEMGEAKAYIDNFYATYAKVGPYKEKILHDAAQKGYVETLLGRRRFFPDLKTANKMARANMERMAFNTVFQGSAADIIKKAMIDLDQALASMKARMILQVHDELIVETPDAEIEKVKKLMEDTMSGAADLKVPLKISLGSGPNWAAAKS